MAKTVKQHRRQGTSKPAPGARKSSTGVRQPSQGEIDYRRAFKRAADAIFIVDAKRRFIDVNPAACKLLGFTRKELLAKRIEDLSAPAARSTTLKYHRQTVADGHVVGEVTLARKDGRIVTVELHAADLGNGHFLTIVHDVSKQVEAQHALERSLDAYSTLVRLCHAAAISTGPDGRVTFWNPAARELFGYEEKEALGLPVKKLLPPRHRTEFEADFKRRLRGAQREPHGHTVTTVGLRKDGTEMPIEVSAAVDRRDSTKIYTAVIRDITAHQEVVERLNDALQQLRFHIERMPLAYIVWDVDFRAVEWNPAAERIFGYRKSEAIGNHAYELIVPPEAVPAVDEIWAELLKGDTASHSVNANRRKDGSPLMCEWFNTPLRDSDGKIRGACSMAMDISEREAMEAQLRNTQRLESLGVLASGVAHDFNSSLMVILGNTALLRAIDGLPLKALECIDLIEGAGFRAKDFITNLLAYARTGRHNPQPTDLNLVVQDALILIRSSIDRRHRLDLQLADRLPAILADHAQIEQVILNLSLNADQALAENGTIDIITQQANLTTKLARRCVPDGAQPGRYVKLVVNDDGCGMDEGTLQRLFDPFFTTKAEGHGLGMATVFGILRQHNAFVLVDSAVGKGTKIQVFFPVHGRDSKRTSSKRS